MPPGGEQDDLGAQTADFVDGFHGPFPFEIGVAFKVNRRVGRALFEFLAQDGVEIVPGYRAIVDVQARLAGIGEFNANEQRLYARAGGARESWRQKVDTKANWGGRQNEVHGDAEGRQCEHDDQG